MTPLILFGVSGHARVIIDAVRCGGRFELAGVIGADAKAGGTVGGVPVLGGEKEIAKLRESRPGLQGIIGIGDNGIREAVARRILSQIPDFVFATVIHPATTIAGDVRLGGGTFVAAGVIMNSGAWTGVHVIVNTRASIDHDCGLDDFSFVAPGATLSGNVSVGRGAFVGTGACVIPGRVIGKGAIVGAGAAIIRDVADDAIVGGVPARPLNSASPGK